MCELASVQGFDKAFAMGAFLYLSDHDRVRALITATTRTADLLALDMPDADLADERPRDYDRAAFPHLMFTVEQIRQWFPDAVVFRRDFGGYVNSAHRFSVLVPRR